MSEVRKNTARFATFIAVVFLSTNLFAAQFEACEKSIGAAPLIVVPSPKQSCPRIDDLALLRTTGQAVASSLTTTVQNLGNSIGLQNELEKTVLSHLETSREKYVHLAACDPTCARELNPMIESLTTDTAKLRVEMALMQPDEVGPIAIETQLGWFSAKPKHPFAKSPALPALSPEERIVARDAFLDRLAQKLPFVSTHLTQLKSGQGLLADTAAKRAQVAQAIVQIQNEARVNYLRAIGANPLLIFLDQSHPELPTSTRDISVASGRLEKEIATEISRLKDLPPSIEKSEAFIEYRPLAESVLKRHPEYCAAADQIAASGDRRRTTQKVALVVGQVAAGFASAALCSTLVSCGLAAAALSSADIGIAAHDAKLAFRQGLGATVTANRETTRDTPKPSPRDQ